MKTKLEVFTATQAADAAAIVGILLDASCWFEVTPLPDDHYEIATKPEGHLLRAGVSTDRIETRTTDHEPQTDGGAPGEDVESPGEHADRLLRLADQFLEDWADDDGKDFDSMCECGEHRAEWAIMRPRLLAAYKLAHTIARMTPPAEVEEPADDSIATLDRLIEEARAIAGPAA